MSSNDIFWILLFFYYSFGVEKTNTFIRSRGSLVNHTRFKTIMVKIYTSFQTKTAQKPYPLGRHIPIYTFNLYFVVYKLYVKLKSDLTIAKVWPM